MAIAMAIWGGGSGRLCVLAIQDARIGGTMVKIGMKTNGKLVRTVV